MSAARIAPVMGDEGTARIERPERDYEEQPSEAIAALDTQPGQVVADVGAGSGYDPVIDVLPSQHILVFRR